MVKSWNDRSLATRFALAGGLVLLLSMLAIGSWVSSRIEGVVVRNTANATAQYMESFISPLSQDLAKGDVLAPGASRALEEIFTGTSLGERVVSYKIWTPGGKVVESSDPTIVGKTFELTENLKRALTGVVRADFADLRDKEDAGEHKLGLPLLEIYSPIREDWSGRIIGAAEFYEVGTALQKDIAAATRNSWAAVAMVLLTIGTVLYGIVLQGSRTIDHQRVALTRQLSELTAMSQRNTRLRLRVQEAAGRATSMHDRALRQIGADLHDGPAQLMGFVALRLDNLRGALPKLTGPVAEEFDGLERAVKDAIREIRGISRGFSLPDIDERCPCDLIRSVIEAHTARTGSAVALTCDLPDDIALSPAVKISLYRMVQEGLNNAWRYAGGKGQAVRVGISGNTLALSVLDEGPGLVQAPQSGAEDGGDFRGLGLAGLRDRVESLGGSFTAGSRKDGQGTEIRLELDMKAI